MPIQFGKYELNETGWVPHENYMCDVDDDGCVMQHECVGDDESVLRLRQDKDILQFTLNEKIAYRLMECLVRQYGKVPF